MRKIDVAYFAGACFCVWCILRGAYIVWHLVNP
jgi:hypothetical protein